MMPPTTAARMIEAATVMVKAKSSGRVVRFLSLKDQSVYRRRSMEDVVVDADAELLERLRAGDEDAFMTLVDRYGPLMLRIALTHVPSRAVAEEVVQEAWLGVAHRAWTASRAARA